MKQDGPLTDISEYGEPLVWKKEETLETEEPYLLCRCGQARNKPFCDGTHCEVWFDGLETADTRPTAERQEHYQGRMRIQVRSDPAWCMNSGF